MPRRVKLFRSPEGAEELNILQARLRPQVPLDPRYPFATSRSPKHKHMKPKPEIVLAEIQIL